MQQWVSALGFVGLAGLGLPGLGATSAQALACRGLQEGQIVRSASPVKEGRGSEKRRYWRAHYRVRLVLEGGRFLADPLFRRDDLTGETDRSRFAPHPAEQAQSPPGALRCEAFVAG